MQVVVFLAIVQGVLLTHALRSFTAVMVIILFEAASSQLVMIPCLAIRPPAAHIAHVGGDGVVGARKVIIS